MLHAGLGETSLFVSVSGRLSVFVILCIIQVLTINVLVAKDKRKTMFRDRHARKEVHHAHLVHPQRLQLTENVSHVCR